MACNSLRKTLLLLSFLLVFLAGCAGQEVRQPEEPARTDPELAASFEKEGRKAFEEGRKGAARSCISIWR